MNPNKKYMRQATKDHAYAWLLKALALILVSIVAYSWFNTVSAQWWRCRVPSQPQAISGQSSVTQGKVYTYSVPSVYRATSYKWTLPVGWKGTSSTRSITVTASATSGTITVRAVNSCGTSNSRTLSVNVTPLPPPIDTCNCATCPKVTIDSIGQVGQVKAIVRGASQYQYTWLLNGNVQAWATQSIPLTYFRKDDCVCLVVNSIGSCPQTAYSKILIR